MKHIRIRAFTLVELLVVIGIIALLIAILIPALGRARNQALRTNCLANLQQIGQIWHMYANDNDGWFPILFEYYTDSTGKRQKASFGNWTLLFADDRAGKVDYRTMFRDRYKVPSGKIFFCPSYRSFTGALPEEDWKFTRKDTSTGTPPDYWTVPTSYAFYAGNSNAEFYSQLLRNNTPPPYKANERRLSDRPIAFDETDYYAPPYSTFVTYGYSNHYVKGQFPDGGNALFGDAHAEWRPWKKMIRVVDAGSFRRYF